MQPSTKFEKEGILYIRERQEGFFRKSESKSVVFACLAGKLQWNQQKVTWLYSLFSVQGLQLT